ncbi:hypothetical protein ACWT_0006 [Actinoplanes sp. SE50]|nr:hypothetical protein ACPL_121 [Actinoplanes sp. SE50/110]ATO79421.1 hypothetical protein ACWT_0006 [Actinoplanes sp. SE50]SLL96821.1 hypothetical protein ACSP50_0006 [Actinoplanes sp. SE50/110]
MLVLGSVPFAASPVLAATRSVPCQATAARCQHEGLAARDRVWDGMRWSLFLGAGAGVLLLIIGGEMWWLGRNGQTTPANPAAADRKRSSPVA